MNDSLKDRERNLFHKHRPFERELPSGFLLTIEPFLLSSFCLPFL